jgi:hypothetical protein
MALVAAACGLFTVASAAQAQVRTSIIDRAKQDEARREALRNADRFGVIDGVVTDTLLQPLNAAERQTLEAGGLIPYLKQRLGRTGAPA